MVNPGTRIGPYEIETLLGAGGMGEVYRARDTRLKRDVALKVLPDSFATDPDRLARFEREAQVLASLNHPHIAGIYGVEEADGTRALVMELVEGPTLADRIAQGALPIEEALPIAQQIAAALEAAHDAGVIHRDLKPANIKLRADNTVKVLDFGLAKALHQGSGIRGQGSGDYANSPTITSPAMTQAGIILGTAAYMSPEQAKGKGADERSDVWSFGVVLYEMLAGQSAFAGATIIEVLGGVVKSDPDWRGLPADLPPAVRSVMRRCLEKNPDCRLRDIREARLQIEHALSEPLPVAIAGSTRHTKSRWLVPLAIVATVSSIIAVALAVRWYTSAATVPAVQVRFEIPLNTFGVQSIAISPDGRQVAYADGGGGGRAATLWVRALNSLAARELPGTERSAQPVWSPDGRSLAFLAPGNRLMKIDLAGGTPQSLASEITGRCAWSASGPLVCTSRAGNIVRVSGATVTPVLQLDKAAGESSQSWPSFLPDGKHFLYLSRRSTPTGTEGQEIRIASLESQTSESVMRNGAMAVYAPPGFLLFVRGAVLMAQRFDASRRQLTGDPVTIVESIATNPASGRAAFDVSHNGTLIYRTLPSDRSSWQLSWLNRSGVVTQTIPSTGQLIGPALSPDENRLAFHRIESGGGDVWVADAAGGTQGRLTFDPTQQNATPVWSPDGSRIVFRSLRNNKWGFFEKAANGLGAEALLTEFPVVNSAMSWSRDGKYVAFMASSENDWDIWVLSTTERKATPLLQTPFREGQPQFSPDGRWIAYMSYETGTSEVYIQSFPPGTAKWQISSGGGVYPRWRGDGKELLYFQTDGLGDGRATLVAVDVATKGQALSFSPRSLFETPFYGGPIPGYAGNYMPWTMTSDAQRFLVPRPLSDGQATDSRALAPLTVVVNWTEGLIQK